ncbi:hypothetical protein Zm00014a_028187 [Zea mays]|uniref:Uncharacterized protein n=2 Tax=Zea mays TaxID=4577 RepID=A0A1D6KCK2_MAIZE|nr:hypothetical protein ZEAMMB73_Zm00001d030498 [Zea mays]PWZ55910.1 hypothetical protein Zm00014a_028187 [Zea mays]
MASMGFSYAQIHVQQERCRMKAQEKEKKDNEAVDEGEEAHINGRPTKVEDNNKAGGVGGASGRVHPCARTAAPAPDHSAR